MSSTVIQAQGLSKKYMLNQGTNGDGLRHAIHDCLTAPIRWFANGRTKSGIPVNGARHRNNGHDGGFWALKDVSFDVKKGEVIGIIGRNGAGKSTLLKILSRITEQTEGRVEICGRVASLLEVGTGFHPELSGRENIYLNGAILGMSRTEIKRKFDEIVNFAEVDQFLETPVKRYSSGMYVRLAFAVAAHLEPEILIVDEVLAVGDAAFQKKCLGKMQDVAHGSGRTILFVSHNMGAVMSLCDRGIYLKNGQIVEQDTIEKVTHAYLKDGCERGSQAKFDAADPSAGDEVARVKEARILSSAGTEAGSVTVGQPALWKSFMKFIRMSHCRG
jgi:lipopolysaccharide transport system ATP-binding protein